MLIIGAWPFPTSLIIVEETQPWGTRKVAWPAVGTPGRETDFGRDESNTVVRVGPLRSAFGNIAVPATGAAMDRATRRATRKAILRAIWRATVRTTGRATRTATQAAMVRATGRATGRAMERATGTAMVRATRTATVRATGTACLLYTSPSPRDGLLSRMPSSA